jgi:pimeloyl-ACP methyl ester carboxylesterase
VSGTASVANDARDERVDVGDGVRLCCRRLGDRSAPPLLLIMGLGRQLITWPQALCGLLVGGGFQVVLFDNRDIGRSWHAEIPPPSAGQFLTRRFDPDQYDLGDMARDTAHLIDALQLGPCHVVGVSMGGMIAQTLAARHPQHVRGLVSVMSTTGATGVGWPAPSTLRAMFRPPPRSGEQAADRAVEVWRRIGSHGYPFDEHRARELARREFERDRQAAAGTGRQLAAVIKSGDRTAELARIAAPTVVVHGDQDRMVHPSGGRATAAAIRGARFQTIEGMGHDLPAGAFPELAELITDHALSVERSRRDDRAVGGDQAAGGDQAIGGDQTARAVA